MSYLKEGWMGTHRTKWLIVQPCLITSWQWWIGRQTKKVSDDPLQCWIYTVLLLQNITARRNQTFSTWQPDPDSRKKISWFHLASFVLKHIYQHHLASVLSLSSHCPSLGLSFPGPRDPTGSHGSPRAPRQVHAMQELSTNAIISRLLGMGTKNVDWLGVIQPWSTWIGDYKWWYIDNYR